MDIKAKRLQKILSDLDVPEWGIADISGLHELSVDYTKAISLLVGFSRKSKKYIKDEYFKLHTEAHRMLDAETEKLRQFLEVEKIPHKMLDGSAFFSYTMAAAQAGLGWIGKSSLLVSKQYGPRVAIQTILINSEITCNEPVSESSCGNCTACSEVCPVHCIYGIVWNPGMNANELRDGRKCEKKGFACGECVMACPK